MRSLVAALCALAIFAPAAHANATPNFHDGTEVHVENVKQLSPRLFALTLSTDLLTAPTNVRVLLPADYDAHPKQRYPVLWLFHGTSGGAADWTAQPGRAQDITADLPLITVMPDAGVNSNGGSWFTDWVNGGAYGPPKWETWHIDRLIPWIDQNLRTIANRDGRAIAGLSQGGFGAMSYAARHPDLFSVGASFSGAIDIDANGAQVQPLVDPIILATEVGLDQVAPNTFFGDRVDNEINWAAHDPATLVGNLNNTHVFAWTGNGTSGPYDTGVNLGGDVIEAGVHTLTTLFKSEMDKRHLPITYSDYGGGTHSWPYWERDLREFVGPLMDDFARPKPLAPIDFQTDAADYTEFGWHVAITRPAREFSTLSNASATGFTLAGSGAGKVTTPAVYRPGATAKLTIGDKSATQKVDGNGALTIAVPLGPGNPMQQYLAGATTKSYSTTVKIDAPAPLAVCASKRTVHVNPNIPRSSKIIRVRARSENRSLTAVKDGRRVKVTLSGLTRGAHKVTVFTTYQLGNKKIRVTTTRTYKTCVAK